MMNEKTDVPNPRQEKLEQHRAGRRYIALVLGLFFAAIAATLFLTRPWWYGRSAKGGAAFDCSGEKTACFALGFWHDGLLPEGAAVPVTAPVVASGKANMLLARWVYDHADCFSAIYTQRAISDVWLKEGQMTYRSPDPEQADFGVLAGTSVRVYQMHRHDPKIKVRTLEALRCALDRLKPAVGEKIVLVAHDHHFPRSADGLAAMVGRDTIVNPHVGVDAYPTTGSRVEWAFWDGLARAHRLIFGLPQCRADVALGPAEH